MLCADLVDVHRKDKNGRTRRAIANLEDISLSGAAQVDAPIPIDTALRICYPKGELQGRVCYCVFREIGYFLGIKFEPGFRWSMREFVRRRLLDPRQLLQRDADRSVRPAAAASLLIH